MTPAAESAACGSGPQAAFRILSGRFGARRTGSGFYFASAWISAISSGFSG